MLHLLGSSSSISNYFQDCIVYLLYVCTYMLTLQFLEDSGKLGSVSLRLLNLALALALDSTSVYSLEWIL